MNSSDFQFTPHIEDAQLQGVLTEIARELAYNYFSNSFGNNYNKEIAHCGNIFNAADEPAGMSGSFRDRWKKGERVRNVIVIGAGAIYDAYKAIPDGKGLREAIREIFEKDIMPVKFLKARFLEEAREITDTTGERELSFENYLYVLSKFFVTQDQMREKIKDVIYFRHAISLFNEVVAHLMKHSFVDVVINFNFEETLDQAIQEEIGRDNYHHIISDGDCVSMEQIIVDGRIQTPVYIKPHGTYSHKSSLRFTNKQYFDLPSDIKNMLRSLLSGTSEGDNVAMRVNIFAVGFAFKSVEFNRILDEVLPATSVIYHIDWEPSDDGGKFFNRPLKEFLSFRERVHHARRTDNDAYRPVPTAGLTQNSLAPNLLTPSLGELFSVIWRMQLDHFRQPYKPRSIARHEISSYLLYDPGFSRLPPKPPELISQRLLIRRTMETSPDFFLDKLMVELFILLNRSGGILDIAEVLKGRVGLYLNKYYEFLPKAQNFSSGKTIYEILQAYARNATDGSLPFIVGAVEYQRGANIFMLASIFEEKHFNSDFEGVITVLTDDLRAMYRQLPIPDGEKRHDQNLDADIDRFLDDLKNCWSRWHSHINKKFGNKAMPEKVRLGKAITLFYRLFRSDFTSPAFKLNFLRNYDLEVFNGKFYTPNNFTNASGKQHMLEELFRLLEKSWDHLYFVIDPKANDPTHHLWESFSRRKVIHTNLARSAQFDHLLLQKEWNIFLSVSETGSYLKPLHYLEKLLKGAKLQKVLTKLRNARFVIICSYESIRQLYPAEYSMTDLIKAHSKHLRGQLEDGSDIIPYSNLSLLILPFNQHNRHGSTFIQSLPGDFDQYENFCSRNTIISNTDLSADSSKPFAVNILGSIYFFRSGLSVSINPIYIGLAEGEQVGPVNDWVFRDQMKMLDAYARHINRALKFEMVKRGEHAIWPKNKWLSALQTRWEKGDDSHEKFSDIKTHELLEVLTRVVKPAGPAELEEE